MIPKARPWARPAESARCDVRDIPGVYMLPNAIAAAATSTAMTAGVDETARASGDDGRACEGGSDREQAAAAIREATEERVDDDLDEAGAEEDGADRERRPAGVVERERREDGERPEEQSRAACSATGRRRSADPRTRGECRRR